MARPEKNTVDYFPHPSRHGKKMAYIRKKYGNNGYATWFIILEQLGDADRHYLDLADEIGLMYLETASDVDSDTLLNIINDLVKLGEFDADLWINHMVLFSQKFVDSIRDAYLKRTNSPATREEILQHLGVSVPLNHVSAPVKSITAEFPNLKGTDNTQTKVEYIKVEESKANTGENSAEFPHVLDDEDIDSPRMMKADSLPIYEQEEEGKEKVPTKRKVQKSEPEIPELEEFMVYAKKWMEDNGKDYPGKRAQLISKYETWKTAGWKDGYGKAILDWKGKIRNTEPHLRSDANNISTTRKTNREPQPGRGFGSL